MSKIVFITGASKGFENYGLRPYLNAVTKLLPRQEISLLWLI